MVKFSREPRSRAAASADSQMRSASASSSTQHRAWTTIPVRMPRLAGSTSGSAAVARMASARMRSAGSAAKASRSTRWASRPGVVGRLTVARRLDHRAQPSGGERMQRRPERRRGQVADQQRREGRVPRFQQGQGLVHGGGRRLVLAEVEAQPAQRGERPDPVGGHCRAAGGLRRCVPRRSRRRARSRRSPARAARGRARPGPAARPAPGRAGEPPHRGRRGSVPARPRRAASPPSADRRRAG